MMLVTVNVLTFAFIIAKWIFEKSNQNYNHNCRGIIIIIIMKFCM